jgi:AraC-like DNA-binding protein
MDSLKNVIAAIAYIEDHLTEKIDLDIVANAVHYSKYYLQRMFTDTVGLTIHDYIQAFEPDRDPLETADPAWAERVKFKSGNAFVKMIDQYLEHAVLANFQPVDYEFGRFKATWE